MIPDDVKEKVMVIGSFSNVRELKLFERESGFSTLMNIAKGNKTSFSNSTKRL